MFAVLLVAGLNVYSSMSMPAAETLRVRHQITRNFN